MPAKETEKKVKTMYEPLHHFDQSLEKGTRLCLLPVADINPPELIKVSEALLLYPQDSVDPLDLRLVSCPADENRVFLRNLQVAYPQPLKLDRIERGWLLSIMTAVRLDEFFGHSLLAFEISMDWDAFLCPGSHNVHLAMMKRAIDVASEHMEEAGFDIGGIAPKGKRPGRLGRLQDSIFDAALFYTREDHESYIVGGQIDDIEV